MSQRQNEGRARHEKHLAEQEAARRERRQKKLKLKREQAERDKA